MRLIDNKRLRVAVAGFMGLASAALHAGGAEAAFHRLYVHFDVPNPGCNNTDPSGSLHARGEIVSSAGNVEVTTLGSTATTYKDIQPGPTFPGYNLQIVRIDPVTQRLQGSPVCWVASGNFGETRACTFTRAAHGSCPAQTVVASAIPGVGP